MSGGKVSYTPGNCPSCPVWVLALLGLTKEY